MQHFAFDDIKRAIPCDAYVRALPGVQDCGGGRYTSPLRADSDSGSFAADAHGWFDHVSKERGSVIDLEARLHHGGDLMAAQEALGLRAGLAPREQEPQHAQRETAVYVYRSAAGMPLYEVVRLEPGRDGKNKTFRQRTIGEDGSRTWGCKSSLWVPYRLDEWRDSPYVMIVEGEKDAEALVALGLKATTLPDGASKWQDRYRQHFTAKAVTILCDNDPAGEYHGDRLAWELRETAARIKIVLPDDSKPGADVSDYLAAGHGKEDLLRKIGDVPWLDAARIAEPAEFKTYQMTAARRANLTPFGNCEWVNGEGEDKGKRVKVPRKVEDMLADLYQRFWDFPRMVGDTLFDHDRKRGCIRFLDSPTNLFAWISEKSGHPVHWDRLSGCVSKEEFYASVCANSRRYSAISGVPSWPKREDVYGTFGELPEPTPDARHFEHFCSFFCPAAPVDAVLLRAAVATPLYYQPGEPRPGFVIDGQGQGSGKTKFVESIALLYGGFDSEQSSPISATASQIRDHQAYDRFLRRCLSTGGRKKRIVLIDNVTGYFGSANYAALQSSEFITGMAPYGRREETRPNDLTIYITSNSGVFDKDLVERCYLLDLARPEKSPTWARDMRAYVAEHRLEIIADIIGLIERGPAYDHVPQSRYAAWEQAVLAPICRDAETYEAVWRETADAREDADREREQGEQIREGFIEAIKEAGHNPNRDTLFLCSPAAYAMVQRIVPELKSANLAMSVLRNLAKTGVVPELHADPQRHYLPGGKRVRGIFWGDIDNLALTTVHVYHAYESGRLQRKGAF